MVVEGEVHFRYYLDDQVTEVTDRMVSAQDRLAIKAKATTQTFEQQRLKNIETLQSLNAFRSGLNAMTSSLHELGVVDDQTYQSMRKVVAGMTLITAGAETLKGAAGIYNMLTAASTRYAISSMFAAVAANPWLAAALIGGGVMAAGGLVYAMNQASSSSSTSTTTNTTNINLYSAPDRTSRVQSAALETGSYY